MGNDSVQQIPPSAPGSPPKPAEASEQPRSAPPSVGPAQRPVAPAEALGAAGEGSGMSQGFVKLFGGTKPITGEITKDSLAASGARVSSSLFDLIDRGMKIEGEDSAATGDGKLTEEEIQQFFGNVAQFMQMAQLPQTNAELMRVALLYNKEGGKYTRVNIEDLQRIGTSVMQAWTGTIPEPYKKAAEFYPRATQPVLDGISRKINSGKAFAEAGMEGQQKALMALQLADSFAININELYDFGERPAMTGKMSEARKQEEAAIKEAFEKMSLENRAKFTEFLTLSQDRAKQKEAMEKWEEIKKDMPPEIVSLMDKGMAEIKQAEEEQKQIEAKIPKTIAAADKRDIELALREFETEKAGLSTDQAMKVEARLKMQKIDKLVGDGKIEEAKTYYESIKDSLPENLREIIGQNLNDPNLPKKVQEAMQAKQKNEQILEDIEKAAAAIRDELGIALGEKSKEKTQKVTGAIQAIFDKYKDNPDFWATLNSWSMSDKVPEQARTQISNRFANYDSGMTFLNECRSLVK